MKLLKELLNQKISEIATGPTVKVTNSRVDHELREKLIDRIESYFGDLKSLPFDKVTTEDLTLMYDTLLNDKLIKPFKPIISSNKLDETKLFEGPWKRLGNHKGILTRTTTPSEREASKKKEEDRNKKRYAASNERKIEELRTEAIPELSVDEVENVIKANGNMIAGTIDHIIQYRPGYHIAHGVRVASVKIKLYIDIDLKRDLGIDDKTIETMYDGNDHTEDMVEVSIWRDPKDPKKLQSSF